MSFEDILKLDGDAFFDWVMAHFQMEPVKPIETEDDMKQASKLISIAIGNYSYLAALLGYLKIKVRQEKRNKNKVLYEDLIDKREIVQEIVDATKLQYNAISRMVTIKIESDKELHMNDIR